MCRQAPRHIRWQRFDLMACNADDAAQAIPAAEGASGEQHRQCGFAHGHDVDRRGRLNRATKVRLLHRRAHERTGIGRLQRRAYDGCQVVAKLEECFQ
jgi:hypothetical protein